jgi:hypothetical protein
MTVRDGSIPPIYAAQREHGLNGERQVAKPVGGSGSETLGEFVCTALGKPNSHRRPSARATFSKLLPPK